MSVIGFKVNGDMIQYNFPNLDNKPTIDATPTANSTNAVQSGGVKSALDTLQAQIPQIDATLSQSGQAADAKVVGDSIGECDDITQYFELGAVSYPSTGWTYATNDTRVRTRKGVVMPLKAGTKIGLTDYVDASFSVGWRDSNGTYGTNGAWRTSEYTTTVDGDYVVSIKSNSGTNQTDETALASLFYGYNVAFDHINDIEDNLSKVNAVQYGEHSGYINADSGTIHVPTSGEELYTDKIPINQGDVFDITLQYNTAQHPIWVAYGLYDANDNFLGRTVLIADKNTRQYKDFVTVSNNEAKYIVFNYRSYSDSTFSVKCTNNVQIVEGKLADEIAKNRVMLYAINENIKSVNHRGFNTIAPENTLPAYKLSKRNGFHIVETDVSFTSDGVPVLLHDDTINRTARNADGTTIANTINIGDITYQQALAYDFGIWKDATYAGTPIPTFDEFLALCKYVGLHPYIELKGTGSTQERVEGLVDKVKLYGLEGNVTWISAINRLLNYVKAYDPKARLGYIVSSITSDVISYVTTLVTSENEVFIDSSSYTDTEIALCQDADLPLEVWTINVVSTLTQIDPYVSGVTSDALIAGYEMYKKNIAI